MNYLVVVDKGHVFDTPGKRTPPLPNGRVIREFEFNSPTGNKLISLLSKIPGMEVVDTNPKGIETSLDTRVRTVDAAARAFLAKYPNGKCLSISIHYNAHLSEFEGSDAQGLEVFYRPGNKPVNAESKRLAEIVYKELLKGTSQKARGVRTADFAMLKPIIPSVLTELGFMDDPREAMLMLDDDFQMECAEELRDGICKFMEITIVPEPIAIPTEPTQMTWKQHLVVTAQKNGIITDFKKWSESIDTPAQVWTVLSMVNNAFTKLDARLLKLEGRLK